MSFMFGILCQKSLSRIGGRKIIPDKFEETRKENPRIAEIFGVVQPQYELIIVELQEFAVSLVSKCHPSPPFRAEQLEEKPVDKREFRGGVLRFTQGFMVGGRGLEPLTSAMSTQRSNQLS
jgi:hypothetical protein